MISWSLNPAANGKIMKPEDHAQKKTGWVHQGLGWLWCFLVFSFLIMSGCSRSSTGRGLIVAGSTSVQPFADRWAEIYMKIHPGETVNVQGGGSSAGIQATREGAADIGMSSRELKPDEKDLIEAIVAWDGLAVITHPANPVRALTLDLVRKIFGGQVRDWRDAGGSGGAITVVTREEGSGTRGAFQELVMKKTRISKEAIVEDSNGTVREIITHDPNAIGYISLGLVIGSVRALVLDGVAPGIENIKTRKYSLIRPFLFLTKSAPEGKVKLFFDFVLSRDGQELIRQEGLIPVRWE